MAKYNVEATRPVLLPSGTKVAVAAVRNDADRSSWRADGTAMATFYELPFLPGTSGTADGPTLVLRIVGNPDRFKNPNMSAPSIVFAGKSGEPAVGWGFTLLQRTLDPKHQEWAAGGLFTPLGGSRAADVWVGFADGTWRTHGAVSFVRGKKASHRGADFVMETKDEHVEADVSRLPPGTVTSPAISVKWRMPAGLEREAVRVWAVDRSGKVMWPGGSGPNSGTMRRTYCDGKLSDLARVEIQVRPYTWIRFKDVHLKPNR